MNSVPSIPGVEVGAPWLDGYEHVLTANALDGHGAPVSHSTRTVASTL
jgi:hypothetical protein